MPVLKNVRHERFARLYAKLGIASRAYRKAGYTVSTDATARTNGSQLLAKSHIKQRVQELQAISLTRSQVTMDKLLTDTEKARLLALDLGQTAPALKATELQARLTGQLVERQEVGKAGSFEGLESREAILRRFADEMGAEEAERLRRHLEERDRVPLLLDLKPNETESS